MKLLLTDKSSQLLTKFYPIFIKVYTSIYLKKSFFLNRPHQNNLSMEYIGTKSHFTDLTPA